MVFDFIYGVETTLITKEYQRDNCNEFSEMVVNNNLLDIRVEKRKNMEK